MGRIVGKGRRTSVDGIEVIGENGRKEKRREEKKRKGKRREEKRREENAMVNQD
jgi:hypothetical protein